MILKAGTYRFNDVLNIYGNQSDYTISLNCSYEGTEYTHIQFLTNNNEQDIYIGFIEGGEFVSEFWLAHIDNNGVTTFYNLQTMEILQDTEVDDTFGTWYIANTNYNEVNAPVEDTIYREKSSWYKSVADAIRNKKGTTDPILRDDFASEISSITGGGETPYYDGTVIIEKAESLLGLRRFKDNYIPIELSSEVDISDEATELFSQYGFTIQTLSQNNESYNGFSCILRQSEGDYILMRDGDGNVSPNTVNSIIVSYYPNFNVLSTANSTVDEWLLANTEGVSV